MNTRKKIINTLRSADKASVERLMAEAAKKDEIFAKVMERAEKENESTDVAEGAEPYNRRMSIVHSASAAAASLLLVAGIWGASHLLKNNNGLIDQHVGENNMTIDITDNNNVATDENTSKNTKTTTTSIASANENMTSVTATFKADGTANENAGKTTETTTTTNDNTEVTTIAEAQQPEQKETVEQLREKCINSVYNYDNFSADYKLYSLTNDGSDYFLKNEGTLKIDNSSMTGEFERTIYVSDGRTYSVERYFFLNDKLVYACDLGKGGLDARITNTSTELPSGIDRVYFKDYNGLSIFSEKNLNNTRWEVTGESNENGRNVTSVTIYYDGSDSSTVVKADIDTDTGICLAYEKYVNDKITERLETSNCRFGNGADTPKNNHEVKEFLENNNYESNLNEDLSDYTISDLE